MEAVCTSSTSVYSNETTRRYIFIHNMNENKQKYSIYVYRLRGYHMYVFKRMCTLFLAINFVLYTFSSMSSIMLSIFFSFYINY
jgi:hypothetical protein